MHLHVMRMHVHVSLTHVKHLLIMYTNANACMTLLQRLTDKDNAIDHSWFAENPFSSKLWMITCLLTWFFRTWTLCSNQSNFCFLMQMCKWHWCDCWHCARLWCVCPWQGRDNTIHELSNVCRGSVYLKMLANYIWLIASMWSIAITHILQTKTVMN